jgi:hypothetical protein
MILHQIKKYKYHILATNTTKPSQQSSAADQGSSTTSSQPLVTVHPGVPFIMGKTAYAEFVSKIRFKPKDFVIIVSESSYPYQQADIWRVEYIQEMWYHCEKDRYDNLAPVFVRDFSGNTRWVNPNRLILNYDKTLEWE